MLSLILAIEVEEDGYRVITSYKEDGTYTTGNVMDSLTIYSYEETSRIKKLLKCDEKIVIFEMRFENNILSCEIYNDIREKIKLI